MCQAFTATTSAPRKRASSTANRSALIDPSEPSTPTMTLLIPCSSLAPAAAPRTPRRSCHARPRSPTAPDRVPDTLPPGVPGGADPRRGERIGDAVGLVDAIRTEGLSKRYGSTLALSGLDLAVSPGEVYGCLGPNGAGKTTTIRLLLGLHRPSAGRAELFGIDAWRDPVSAHRRVGYVAGEPFLWPGLTAAETLAYLARLRGGTDERYRDVLVERFRLELDKKVRALSKGNRQKVQLVAAFASRADLLILDEPTSGLDPLMEVAFRETVQEAKQRGQTVFLSSHILSEVEALCDRVGILRQGRLVDEGTLAGPAPSLPAIPGVRSVAAGANALRFEVTGPIQPLLGALAEKPVVTLTS